MTVKIQCKFLKPLGIMSYLTHDMEVSSDCNKMLFSAVFIKDASVQEIRFIQQKTLHKILSIKDILKPTGK